MSTDTEQLFLRLESLSVEQQQHFKTLVTKLAACYGDDSESAAILIFVTDDHIELISANAGELEANAIIHAMSDSLKDAVKPKHATLQ